MIAGGHWRERLRRAIDATNKKHSFIAEQAGIAPATLSRILRGVESPRFETVAHIAYAAGVKVGDILDEREVEFTKDEIAVLCRARDILMVKLAAK